ncbi:MAG: AMP-binding protein [Bacteroidota bacterium]|nr:AMP-binding protein [Bacteroidota bacterium]
MFQVMTQAPNYAEADLSSLRFCTSGGAPLPVPLVEKYTADHGIRFKQGFGMTEFGPGLFALPPEDAIRKAGSIGRPNFFVDVRVVDENDQPLGPNEIGELVLKGPSSSSGYWNNPEASAEVLDDEGWFHTGDVGHLEDGIFLMITDRKKEIFKLSSGKFIAPQPIENMVKESALIDQVMVVGEHQKFASALLVPDFKYLKEWCTEQKIPNGREREELIALPEVVTIFNNEIAKINQRLNDWERLKRVRIVPDDWSPATGELSASLKLKRKVVVSRYEKLLESIYN